MERETIRDFSGRVIAYYEHQLNGDIIVRAFNGIILGKYDKQCNVTRDFYGRIITRGCVLGLLIQNR